MTQLNNMIETIQYSPVGVAFLCGNEPIEAIAQDWLTAGFCPMVAKEYMAAGCFDAHYAGNLREAGITPEEAGTVNDESQNSYGYDYCNCDISLSDVVEVFRKERQR